MSEEEEHAQDLNAEAAGHSPTRRPRSGTEDLPPELKSLEAELASLNPRADRLDRDRLIFLAGQQSVVAGAGRTGTVPISLRDNRDSPRVRWAWPAAFAAMTAVAAALLVMVFRFEPQVEVRVVKVPVERTGNGKLVPGPEAPRPPSEGPRLGPLPEGPEPSPRPAAGSGLLALVGLDWEQLYDRDRFGSETSYPGLRDRVLREGVDSWPGPSPVADVKPASAPLPYRKLLNRVLGSPGSDESVPDRPLIPTLFYPGANS